MSLLSLLPSLALGAPVIDAGPAVPGAPLELLVTGADPGATVVVFASRAGPGPGPCAGGTCLDLLSPVVRVGQGVADANGAFALAPTLPARVALGAAWLQAGQDPPRAVGPVLEVEVRAPVRVLMVGDSITEGQQSAPADRPYTEVTASELGPAYDVVSVGCGGATTADWVPGGPVTLCGGQWWSPNVYEARAIPELPVDVATVMLGTNDSTGFFEPAPLPPRDYAANLDLLVDGLLADGAGIVMLMTPPPMCSTADPATVARLEAYRQIVTATCTSRAGVTCGPDVYTLLGPADFAGCDVHPNGQGHRVLGEAVADAVRALY